MTKYVELGEIISNRIRKGKKASRRALKKNFFSLLLCWFLTAVFTFAAWGIYVFIDFAGFFIGIQLDFVAAGVALFGVIPIFLGNVEVARNTVKGRKANVYSLFDGYFNLKQFWLWFLFFVISVSPGWILTALSGSFADRTGRFLPFLKGDVLMYASVLFEIVTVVMFFFNLCRSLYFLSRYRLCETVKETKLQFEKTEERYSKRRKYFRKYMLSHLHFILIILLARAFPLVFETIAFTLVLGYLALCISSFPVGFGNVKNALNAKQRKLLSKKTKTA